MAASTIPGARPNVRESSGCRKPRKASSSQMGAMVTPKTAIRMSAGRLFMRSVSGVGVSGVWMAQLQHGDGKPGAHTGADDDGKRDAHGQPSERVPERPRVPDAENGGERGEEQEVPEHLRDERLQHLHGGMNVQESEQAADHREAENEADWGDADEKEKIAVTPEGFARPLDDNRRLRIAH